LPKIEPICIRQLRASDIQSAKTLLTQLGYDIDYGELSRRLRAVSCAHDHEMLIAEIEENVVGLMHIFVRPALEKPVEAIVQALVVDENFRGKGVGRALMSEAESWATRRELRSVALYAGSHREAAYDFYESIGFDNVGSAELMRRMVGND